MEVLIVDDSPLMVTKITELLEDIKGITSIKTSSSYNDAIRTIDHCNPNVILLDINLPGKSGIELLKYVKIHHSATKVIMVSNQNSSYYQHLCVELGADGFIDKSIDFEAIPSLLSSFT